MPKDETLRPFCLWLIALLMLPTALTTDVAFTKWLALGAAIFLFTAAGWFFREVWQARQSSRSSGETHATGAAPRSQ